MAEEIIETKQKLARLEKEFARCVGESEPEPPLVDDDPSLAERVRQIFAASPTKEFSITDIVALLSEHDGRVVRSTVNRLARARGGVRTAGRRGYYIYQASPQKFTMVIDALGRQILQSARDAEKKD